MKLCPKTNLCTTEFAGLKRMQSCVEIVAEFRHTRYCIELYYGLLHVLDHICTLNPTYSFNQRISLEGWRWHFYLSDLQSAIRAILTGWSLSWNRKVQIPQVMKPQKEHSWRALCPIWDQLYSRPLYLLQQLMITNNFNPSGWYHPVSHVDTKTSGGSLLR